MAIKAKLKPRTGCEIVLECEMGRGELEAAYERTYKRLSRHVEIAGFRRGHAPRELVEQRFGRVIQDQTLEDVILEVIRRVVKQYNLEMVGGVRGLDEVVYPEEGPLRFALEFEVRPKVKLQSYTGIPLKKRKVEVREQDVESIIKELLEREATYEPPVEARAAGYGDWLVVDYTGKVDGETVVKREEAWVEVTTGGQVPVPGFAEQLVGAQKGESRMFSLTAPPEHPVKKLAGKAVEFSVHVREVYERRVPALTDELAQRIMPGCKTVEELRAAVQKNQEQYLEAAELQRLRELAREALVRMHPLAVPPSEVAARARRIMESEIRARLQRGTTEQQIKEGMKEIEQQARTEAEYMVRAEYVLQAIAKELKLEMTEEDLTTYLEPYARSFRRDVKWVRAMFERDGKMERTRELILQEKALDYVVKHAKISEE